MLGAPSVEEMIREEADKRAACSTADSFFSRGPVSCCPAAICCRTLCRAACADPCGNCAFVLRFRPDLRFLSPCTPAEVRFEAIVATIRSLSQTAPRSIVVMQAITDLAAAQPCMCHLLAHVFGEGVSSAPASSDVLGGYSTDGLFSERGLWLFPKHSARYPTAFPKGFPETYPRRACVDSDGRYTCGCSNQRWYPQACEMCCGCCAPAGPAPPLPSVVQRVILYVHGGAFVLTNAETYPTMIGFELVRRTGAALLLPNFARPPHARFPTQLLALSLLLKKLIRHYGAHRVAVAGDSAGANLAVRAVLHVVADGYPSPCCLLLISPWIDLSTDAGADTSMQTNKATDFLVPDLVHLFTREYLTSNSHRSRSKGTDSTADGRESSSNASRR